MGSAEVWRRLTEGAAAWVRKGPGRPQRIVRLLMLLAGLYFAGRVVHAVPNLMWLLTSWWLIASWRAGKPPPGAQAAAVERTLEHSPDDVREATLEWIRERIGDRQGVHLRDLLAHAQAHGMFEGLEVSDLRAHLERWGIPVRDRQRVRGLGVTVGVRREDLPAPSGPSPAAAPEKAA